MSGCSKTATQRGRAASTATVLLLLLVIGWLGPAPAVPQTGGQSAAGTVSIYEQLSDRAAALVTVDFVLKLKMEGVADREVDGQADCLVLDAGGLAVCSNSAFGGFATRIGQLMGGRGSGVSAQPSDLEVRVDGIDERLAARLVSRDSDRDLVWIQIAGGERPLTHVDLTRPAELGLGQAFYVLRRMDSFFGRQPLVQHGRIGALLTQPRRLWAPSTPINAGYGKPVFDAQGVFAGITVLQLPSAEDTAGGLMEPYPSFLTGSTRMQDMASGLILPAADLARATELVREIQAADENE